jgi:hypothetical protein
MSFFYIYLLVSLGILLVGGYQEEDFGLVTLVAVIWPICIFAWILYLAYKSGECLKTFMHNRG